jgi:hypothetical protein
VLTTIATWDQGAHPIGMSGGPLLSDAGELQKLVKRRGGDKPDPEGLKKGKDFVNGASPGSNVRGAARHLVETKGHDPVDVLRALLPSAQGNVAGPADVERQVVEGVLDGVKEDVKEIKGV